MEIFSHAEYRLPLCGPQPHPPASTLGVSVTLRPTARNTSCATGLVPPGMPPRHTTIATLQHTAFSCLLHPLTDYRRVASRRALTPRENMLGRHCFLWKKFFLAESNNEKRPTVAGFALNQYFWKFCLTPNTGYRCAAALSFWPLGFVMFRKSAARFLCT